MNEKNKNVIIGGLLAIVFVMAVGYAAFSTTLNINGSAKIDSSWDVEYDTTKTTEAEGVVTPAAATGITAGTTNTPSGTVNYDNNLTATLKAKLYQPGDSVTYTLTILNKGTLNAKLETPTLSTNDTTPGTISSDLTYTKGNIKFTVTAPTPSTIDAKTGSATMTVKAEYINNTLGNTAAGESASVTITTIATQA